MLLSLHFENFFWKDTGSLRGCSWLNKKIDKCIGDKIPDKFGICCFFKIDFPGRKISFVWIVTKSQTPPLPPKSVT